MFKKVALIGTGMIGSSLSLAIKERGLAQEISGWSDPFESCQKALKAGVIDSAFKSPEEVLKGSDLVVIAVPVGCYREVMVLIKPFLKEGTILTDVGSVKEAVVETLLPLSPREVPFVPGHPIAGSEKSGPLFGSGDLFKDRWVITTPYENFNEAAFKKVEKLWECVGAKVSRMSPQHHDQLFAVTSHLPHLVAYSMVGTAINHKKEPLYSELIQYAASGFKEFTRLAASNPQMWHDIFLSNKREVLSAIKTFQGEIATLSHAIEEGDSQFLMEFFTHTKKVRDEISAQE